MKEKNETLYFYIKACTSFVVGVKVNLAEK